MRKTVSALGCFAVMCGSAMALQMKDVPVRCTMPNGKVTNEYGSCPPGAKIEITRSVSDSPSYQASDQWGFERVTDGLTGRSQCLAISPRSYLPGRRGSVPGVRVIVSAEGGGPVVRVELLPGSEIFHHNIAGTGMRVGAGQFTPFSARPSQTLLLVPQGMNSLLVSDMQQAQDLRLRARLWPWDETTDSPAIPLSGFKQAYAQALTCSK